MNLRPIPLPRGSVGSTEVAFCASIYDASPMTAATQERRRLDLPESGRARRALEKLVSGDATTTLVMIHGPAGCGKSRLVADFADRIVSARALDLDGLGDVETLAIEDVQFLPRTRV